MRKILRGLAVAMALLTLTGCVPLLLMTIGGISVYAVSRDTLQGDSDTSYESLWDAAMTVCKARGTLLKEEFTSGVIEADARPSKIWVRFERLTPSTTRVRVSARKYKLPNLQLAQEVFIKILELSKSQE